MFVLDQNDATIDLVFLMVDSTDSKTGKTGLTPTVTLAKNGGTFNTPAGAVTEMAHGFYKVAANATDKNTLGSLALHATAAGADPADVVYAVRVAPLSAAAIAAAFFARTFHATKMGGKSFEVLFAHMANVLLSKTAGMNGATGTVRNIGDSATGVSTGLDGNGNRTSVTLTDSAVV